MIVQNHLTPDSIGPSWIREQLGSPIDVVQDDLINNIVYEDLNSPIDMVQDDLIHETIYYEDLNSPDVSLIGFEELGSRMTFEVVYDEYPQPTGPDDYNVVGDLGLELDGVI